MPIGQLIALGIVIFVSVVGFLQGFKESYGKVQGDDENEEDK